MKYRITHTTCYRYSQPVGLCQNEARLQPRDFWRQHCDSSRFDITPMPTDFHERLDFFGNRVAYFAIQQPHTQLTVTAISDVTIYPKQNTANLFNPMTWEQVRSLLQGTSAQGQVQSQQGQSQSQLQNQDQSPEILEARQYLLDSLVIDKFAFHDTFAFAFWFLLPVHFHVLSWSAFYERELFTCFSNQAHHGSIP